MACFLPFQNGKNPLLTVETVAEWNRTVPTEQALTLPDGLGVLWKKKLEEYGVVIVLVVSRSVVGKGPPVV